MDSLEQRIARAKEDKEELNGLLTEYLPFIKSQSAKVQSFSLEPEDAQSISMMVFTNCVLQYHPGSGSFLAFVRTCIHNRLIDESRKAKNLPTSLWSAEDTDVPSAEAEASLRQYDREQERSRLCEEIDELAAGLTPFGVTFAELPRICPKQRRARQQCLEIAAYITSRGDMRDKLRIQHRLSQNELAEQFHLSTKTIEKHRKYIVTLALLLSGDYPCIRSFLPQRKEARL